VINKIVRFYSWNDLTKAYPIFIRVNTYSQLLLLSFKADSYWAGY